MKALRGLVASFIVVVAFLLFQQGFQVLMLLHLPIGIDDVAEITVWGMGIPEGLNGRPASVEESEQIISWFKEARDLRLNPKFAGTTSEAGITIKLQNGREVNILRSAIKGWDFEVQREILSFRYSYWMKQRDMREFLDHIATSNSN